MRYAAAKPVKSANKSTALSTADLTATNVDSSQQTDVKNGTEMSYQFHRSHAGIDDDKEALNFTKRMLAMENRERLSEATIAEYEQVEHCVWLT
jgi:hypothetical protein